jgi:YD repeat-containing protein
LPDSEHSTRWRGYEYNREAELTRVWAHDGANGSVDDSSVARYGADSSAVNWLATSHNNSEGPSNQIDPWNYVRDAQVGSLLAIENANTGVKTWESASPRGTGYELTEVDVDGDSYNLSHDAFGRVTDTGRHQLVFDERGRLIGVRDQGGQTLERIYYDASGKMVRHVDDSGNRTDFVWDRSHIIEKHEIDADTYWQFTWGAFTNQLLETREYDTSSGSPQLANKFVPLADHRQSVTAVWDALAGEMKSVYDYDPHGRVMASFANETVRCQEQGNPDTVCLTESGMGIGTNVRCPVTGMVEESVVRCE